MLAEALVKRQKSIFRNLGLGGHAANLQERIKLDDWLVPRQVNSVCVLPVKEITAFAAVSMVN